MENNCHPEEKNIVILSEAEGSPKTRCNTKRAKPDPSASVGMTKPEKNPKQLNFQYPQGDAYVDQTPHHPH
jgi:hypothetical protein